MAEQTIAKPRINDIELVELALSGKHPNLLASLLSQDTTTNIWLNMEGRSTAPSRT